MIKNGQDLPEGKEGEKKLYELSFLLAPSLGETDVAEEFSEISSLVEKRGGAIRSSSTPLMRELSYPMAKVSVGHRDEHGSAYFGWMFFEGDPSEVSSIVTEVNMRPKVIRSLLIETVEEAVALSEKAQRRLEERDTQTSSKEEKVLSEVELDKTIENLVIE